MALWEPREFTLSRRERMAKRFPELASTDPSTLLKVDAYTSAGGRLPSPFTQETVRIANEAAARPRPRPTGAQFRALNEIGDATPPPPPTPGTTAGVTSVEEYERLNAGYAPQVERNRALDAQASFGRSALELAGMAGTLIDSVTGAPIRGALQERPGMGTLRGAWEGARDPSTASGRDLPGIVRLPDKDVLPFGLSARDVAGGVAEVGLDVGIVGGVARGGVRAAGRGAATGARAVNAAGDASALRTAGGPAESAARGVLDRQVGTAVPTLQGTRLVRPMARPTGRELGVPARIADDAVADVQPFRVKGPPTYTPDEVLGTAQSESARLYAATAQKADEPVYGGVVDALEQAAAAVRTDPQGVVSRLAGRVPGLRAVRNWDRPGLTQEKRLLEGVIARRGVENQLTTGQSPKRYDSLRVVESVFGPDAANGGRVLDDLRVDVDTLHRVGGAEYPGTGTVYDYLQRPYAYKGGDDAAAALTQWAKTDEGMRALVNERYGTEIGHFVPERGGAYVPNVNVSQARQATLDNLARAEALAITGTGKSKPRVWESGFARWKNDLKRVEQGIIKPDAVFVPETDLRVLGYTSDLTKARAAGNMTMRAATGGRTISEVKEIVAPGLVQRRDQLRQDITSIAGRIQRATQSGSRDAAIARRLESQADQTARRAEDVGEQAERRFRPPQREIIDETAQAFPVSDPEVDAIIARMVDQPQTLTFERMEAVVTELDRRVTALNRAAQGPRTRAELAEQGVEMLRDDLLALKDQYADVKRAYDATGTQDFVQSSRLPGRYFPSAETAQIDELMRPAKDNVLTRFMEGWRSQVLAGDIGPLTGIQGIIAAASGRAGTTRAVAGAFADAAKGVARGEPGALLRPYTQEAMEQFIRENTELVQEFAFYTGRNVGGRLPSEIGQGGALAKIPGFVSVNEGMFNVVTRRQIEMFRRVRDDLVKAGYSAEEGAAAAADLSNKVLPLMTPARLGQSAAKAQEQRFLPTSLGFIRQPLALTEEAFTTLGRLASGQSVTPRQKLALSIYGQMMGNLMAASIATAAINAQARGGDVTDAIQNALDPGARAFMAVSVGGQTIPLANVFRSPLRVGIGMVRNILNPAVERATGRDISQGAGASPVNYATARIGPPVRAALETATELTAAPWNRKYQGDSDVLRLLSAAGIAIGGALPIPASGIGEEVMEQRKEGEFDPVRLAQVGTTEFGGGSLIPEEPTRTLDVQAQREHGVPFTELTPREQSTILAADPKLAKTSERVRRERVVEQLADAGFTEIATNAWTAIRDLNPEIAEGYDAYRDQKMPALVEIAREQGDPDPQAAAARMFGRLTPVKQYRGLLASRRKSWALENAKNGLAQLAVDYNFLASNEDIRRILTAVEPVR